MISIERRVTRQYVVSTPHSSIIIKRDGNAEAKLDISNTTQHVLTALRHADLVDLRDACNAALEDWE